jgi:glycosyltransferase involved in cell wall biosynthesis
MTKYQRITFIIPCRNNLRFLQQAVSSIEEHYGDGHDIVIMDDASTDDSWEWIEKYGSDKNHILTYRNGGKDRVGHTVLYDIGIQLARTPIVTILHSDMIITPNYVGNMLKHLKPMSVVSATRIEPPLHPPGPEKYVKNFGMDVNEFTDAKSDFLKFVYEAEYVNEGKVTNGIFAPWMLYKEDFTSIGGHDKLFAPMELEDSDIFNRFHLNGYQLIQSRDAFVYHMTCRGSRFKDGIEIEKEIPLPDGTIWFKPKDSEEYLELRATKFREWWRKWHTDVLHDDNMMPIVPKRYATSFIVENCTSQLLSILEPWCDDIYVDCEFKSYVLSEESKSDYTIMDCVHSIDEDVKNNVQIKFDASKLTNEHFTEFIKKLPFIIEETNQLGKFNWDIFEINILSLKTIDMIKPHFKNVF